MAKLQSVQTSAMLRAWYKHITSMGGKAAAAKMTDEQRKDRARKGGLARAQKYCYADLAQ